MEQLLLPVGAAGLRARRGGRQVGHLLLEEVRVCLRMRMGVHPATQAAVRRLGSLLLLRCRRSYWQIVERRVDCGGSVLYLLLLLLLMLMMVVMMMMLMLSLHAIAMVMIQAGV